MNFSLAGLDIDTGKYDAIDQSQIDSIRREKLARGDKAAMDVLGSGWERQKAADILGDLARNSGSAGTAAGAGMSMGMGMAAGNAWAPWQDSCSLQPVLRPGGGAREVKKAAGCEAYRTE